MAVIGESGMNVQMILIQKGDENFDKAIMSENKRNELDDAEKDQEVILDDRKAVSYTHLTLPTTPYV